MLKIKMGIHELYSHWMEEEAEWNIDALLEYISGNEIKSFEELIDHIENGAIDQYKSGMLDLKGNTGNGSWYDGNDDDGHDRLRVEFDYPKDLEERLKPYFVV